MQAAEDELEEDPAYQAWLRKKLAEQSDAGSVADLSLPASLPGAPDDVQASAASAALHSLSLTAADGPQPQQDAAPGVAGQMVSERFKFSEMVTPPPAIVAFIVWVSIVFVFFGGR